jgi:hypothetical protein
MHLLPELLEIITLELFDSVTRLVTTDCKASEVGDLLETGRSGIEKGSYVLSLLFVDIVFLIRIFIVFGVFLFYARIFVFMLLG